MKKVLLILALILLPTFVHADALISNGLVGYWTFDGKDMPSGRAFDRSGNGRTGYTQNIATSTFYTQGVIGQGLKFDGVDDYIVSTTNPFSAYPFTENVWFKAPTTGGGSIISYANTASNVIYYDIHIAGSVPNQVLSSNLRSSAGEETSFNGSTTLTPGKWYMATLILNSSVDHKLYINGVLDGSDTVSIPFVAGDNITIGLTNRGAQFGWWSSSVDEARFYNRALSTTELLQLYNNGKVNFITPPLVSNGLVGYWNFDGKTIVNGHINDNSGKGNTGYPFSISTSTFYTGGKIGQGIKLDGVDDYVKITQTSGLPVYGTAGYSVSFWVRGASGQTNMCIYCEANTGDDNPFFRIITGNSDTSKLQINIRNTAGSSLTSSETSGTVFDNKWHHVVWTDNNGTGIVYIDGVSNTNISYTPSATSLNDSSIGSLIRSSVSSFFKGNVDEVRTYNRVLSATEVTQLYNNGKVALLTPSYDTNGLVGWWTMDGIDTPNRASDRSGNNNTGYLTNIATSTFYSTGKIGQGFNFDGTNDYVKVGAASSINNLGPVTYAMWINPTGVGTGSFGGAEMLDKRYRVFHIADSAAPTIPIVTRMFISTSVTNAQPYCSNIGITPNTWTHVAVTWDGAIPFTGTFYVNGVACVTSVGQTGVGTTVDDSTEPLYVGKRFDDSGFFPGKMDDVRIYNRVLSATEIRQLYNSGINIINK